MDIFFKVRKNKILINLWREDMSAKVFGIDFGTSMLKIYKKNEGIIFDAKNIIAIADGNRVIAIGDEAFEMYGKAPSNILELVL